MLFLPVRIMLDQEVFVIQNLGQVAVTVQNVEEAVSFYRDVLGLPMLFRAGNMAFFDCGGVRLMLTPPEGVAAGNSILYFRTADIQAEWKKLENGGAKPEREPHVIARMPDHDLWMAFFRDPAGNVMALMQEARKA
jgi:methylmalonyl-CoA/ethylmalonyl-CoA epimerase